MRRIYVFTVTGFTNQVEIPAYSLTAALGSLGKRMSGYVSLIKHKKITITLEEIRPYGIENEKDTC